MTKTQAKLAQALVEAWGDTLAGEQVAPSAEHMFFKDPQDQEITQLVDPDAPPPPTPTENVAKPGGDQFSSLARYVVQTKQPGTSGLPKSWDELPKETKIAEWGE